MTKPVVEIIIIDETRAKLPAYATPGSAAFDLAAAIDEPITIPPEKAVLIPTGIKVHLNNPGMVGFILPRSGKGHKFGIVLGNGTGVIDSDYQGELMVSVLNRNDDCSIMIEPGDHIAQYVVLPVIQVDFKQVTEFSADSARGEGGFGSTGK